MGSGLIFVPQSETMFELTNICKNRLDSHDLHLLLKQILIT